MIDLDILIQIDVKLEVSESIAFGVWIIDKLNTNQRIGYRCTNADQMPIKHRFWQYWC